MAFAFRRFTDTELAAMTPAEHDAYFRPLTPEEIPAEMAAKIAALGRPPAGESKAG